VRDVERGEREQLDQLPTDDLGDHEVMSLNFDAVQSVRELPAVQHLPRGCYVPTSKTDVHELRQLQYFLEHPDAYCPAEIRRQHIDALKRMLHTMENGDPKSPAWWVAAALRKSMRKISPTMYVVADRELQTWAMDQIFELFPDEDSHGLRSGH
jgi:hypothetical protein